MTSLCMTVARPMRRKAMAAVPAIALLLCASLLAALETPSKPFLDRNSFYLSSAGFRVQVANDAAGKKALRALPPHRFVIHRYGSEVRLASGANIGVGDQALAYLAARDYPNALSALERAAAKVQAGEPDAGFFRLRDIRMNIFADPNLERPEFVIVRAKLTGR